MTLIPALLLPLSLSLACHPVVKSDVWTAHANAVDAAFQAYPSNGTAPELSDGTISIKDSQDGAADGDVFVVFPSSTSTEAFVLDVDFKGFRDAADSEYIVLSDATPNLATVYDPHVGSTVCKPTTATCVAKHSFQYGAVPPPAGLPATVPAGAQVIEYEVFNRDVSSCDGTPTYATPQLRGWLYRERGIVNDQERWNQHWFLMNSSAPTPYVYPTKCDSMTHMRTDLVVKRTVVKDSAGNPLGAPRSLKAAVSSLTAACTGSQTGCGVCDSANGPCDYALLHLDWMKYAP
ncbi:hypothetical protein L6R53_29130 [Myxococcota bacterium]|nr:hypothetical protein [Myxococcota bacterium]